jgi:hypothetical protein
MRKILFGALVVVVLVVEVAMVDRFFTSRNNHIFDFLLRWHGAQALIFESKDPYSAEVTERNQMELLGRPISPDRCQQGFLYPAYIAFAIPHFLLPAHLALSTWIVTQQVLLVIAIWLIVASTRSQEGIGQPRLLALTLAGITYLYSLQNLGYAQFSIYVLFWLVLAWRLWEKERYLLSGMALTLVTSKPQLALVILPLWLLLAAARRHWSFIAGFTGMMIGWLIMPCPLVGNWVSGFLGMAKQALDTCQVPVYEGSALILRLGISIPLMVALCVVWFSSLRKKADPAMGFLLSLSISVTLLVTPFVHHYDLVLTLLPLLSGLSLLSQSLGRGTAVLKAAYWSTLLVLPWILWGLAPDHIQGSVQLWLTPLVVLALVVALRMLQRRQWKIYRPKL